LRILIYGAGAIGSDLGGMLCQAGADVTLLARGDNLAALQRQGLRVHRPGQGVQIVPVRAVDASQAGHMYDLVVVTLKAMQLEPVAQDLVDRLAPQGTLLMIQNGLPWWYFEHQAGPSRPASIPCLDPQGVLARTIPLDRVVGAVIYKPVTSVGPGEILLPQVMPPRLIVGEVDNQLTPRLHQVQQCLTQAGLNTEVTDNIRLAKWQKLMMNLIWNPLCAIMQVSPGYIVADPRARALAEQMIVEGRAIAWACDMPVQVDPEAEIVRVSQNFNQTPSMLQDIRAGRPVELDAIVNAVIEIGDLFQVPCPALKTVAGILGVLNQSLIRTREGIGPR
jgi:2-dehydropantoate 2-reductase